MALRKRYAKLLGDIHNFLQNRSIKLMFVILPSHHQIGERTEFSDLHDLRVKWLLNFAQQKGIPTVNILKVFKDSNLTKRQLYLLPYDGHHSAFAYDIVAKTIFKKLHMFFPDKFTVKI